MSPLWATDLGQHLKFTYYSYEVTNKFLVDLKKITPKCQTAFTPS